MNNENSIYDYDPIQTSFDNLIKKIEDSTRHGSTSDIHFDLVSRLIFFYRSNIEYSDSDIPNVLLMTQKVYDGMVKQIPTTYASPVDPLSSFLGIRVEKYDTDVEVNYRALELYGQKKRILVLKN